MEDFDIDDIILLEGHEDMMTNSHYYQDSTQIDGGYVQIVASQDGYNGMYDNLDLDAMDLDDMLED